MPHSRMPSVWLFILLGALWTLAGGAVQAVQARSEYYYTGKASGQPVQVDLTFADSAVSGTFYCECDGLDTNVKGKAEPNGTVTLTETDAKGNKTGTITGTVSPDKHRFSGVWHNAEGSRSRQLKLDAVAAYVLQQQTFPQITITTAYPRFFTSSPALKEISRHAKESIDTQQQKFLQSAQENVRVLPANNQLFADYRYAIKYYTRNLVSLLEELNEFPGGAHPSTNYLSYNVQIVNGIVEPFELANLFKPDTPCFDALSEYLVRELRHRGAEWVANGQVKSFKPADLTVFYLRPTTVTFVFPPYAVGPYAQGEFFVRVPLRQVCASINPNGPVGNFMMTTP